MAGFMSLAMKHEFVGLLCTSCSLSPADPLPSFRSQGRQRPFSTADSTGGCNVLSVLMVGLRGVGKTVLLDQMRHDAEASGAHTVVR